jgi:tetratricopeptide (TPR) repeat protein
VKKTVLALVIIMLLAAAILQWGLDRTPAGADKDEIATFPAASSLLDLLGGARQYLAFTFYIKTDKLHHAYYGSATDEAELVPYFMLIALMDPNYESAYYVGAGIIDALGNRDAAIDFTRQGIKANPASADLYYSLGAFYLEEKQYEKAKEAFEQALQHQPETISKNQLLTALAAACSALGDEEAQRRTLMEKALYNEMRLYDMEMTYEQVKNLVRVINDTLNAVTAVGEGETQSEDGR